MGRVKDAKDWLLTWSPEEGVSTIPEAIREFLEGRDVTRYYAVCEEAGKAHIHAIFSTSATYNSDYKWWRKIFAEAGFKEPALDIKYHDNPIVCAGGYLQGKEIGRKGFSDEQLAYGKQQYQLRNLRQRIRKFADDHIVISRDKFDAAIGGIMAEADCDEDRAILIAREAGFAFGTSKRGGARQYKDIYTRKTQMS